jgi:predicted RNA binding protein YcfA (HicA-like mRNA interferase family)
MSQIEKKIGKLLQDYQSLHYRDIEKILLYFGFERVQAKGSHVKFKSYYYKLDISIPVHRGDCKIGYKWEAQQIVRKIWKK